jgi:hypothetical protein
MSEANVPAEPFARADRPCLPPHSARHSGRANRRERERVEGEGDNTMSPVGRPISEEASAYGPARSGRGGRREGRQGWRLTVKYEVDFAFGGSSWNHQSPMPNLSFAVSLVNISKIARDLDESLDEAR